MVISGTTQPNTVNARDNTSQQGVINDAHEHLSPPIDRPYILYHRVREVAWHIPWYGFKTQARLARDAQIVPSTVSRVLRGKELPSLVVALRLTQALSQRSGRTLDVSEVFSLNGAYPTASVCTLMGCPKCLPPSAFDEEDNLVAEFKGVEAGKWSLTPATKGSR